MTERCLLHRFDPTIASVYGITAALIYQYITFRSARTHGRFVAVTLADLEELYPYIGRWQLWAGLRKLTHPGKKTPALLHRQSRGGGYVYAPVATENNDAVLHSFDAQLATRIGVVPAIIYGNISHWIRSNWQEQAEKCYAYLDPARFDYDDGALQHYAYQHTRLAAAHQINVPDWVKLRPYLSLRTAERGFSLLCEHKLLTRNRINLRRTVWRWTASSEQNYLDKLLNKNTLGDSSAKTKHCPPKPNTVRQNQTLAAKTKQDSATSDCAIDTCETGHEALVEETVLRSLRSLRLDKTVAKPNAELPAEAHAWSSPRTTRLMRTFNAAQFTQKAPVKRNSLNVPVAQEAVYEPGEDEDDFFLQMEVKPSPEKAFR